MTTSNGSPPNIAALDPLDIAYLKKAVLQAKKAWKYNEVPVGSLVVRDGIILSAAFNRKESTCDPTAHAELLAIRKAAKKIQDWRLDGATLYSTLEPCPLCAGAILQSRIARVVFGAWDHRWGAAGSVFNVFEHSFNHSVELVYADMPECATVLKAFFRERRKISKPFLDSV